MTKVQPKPRHGGRVNLGHPLAAGLIHAWDFLRGSTQAQEDSVGGILLTDRGSSGTPTLVATTEGLTTELDAVNNHRWDTDSGHDVPVIDLGQPFTITARVRWSEQAGTTHVLVQLVSADDAEPFILGFSNEVDRRSLWWGRDGETTEVIRQRVGAGGPGTWSSKMQTLALVYDGSGHDAGGYTVYREGVVDGSPNNSSAILGSGANRNTIGSSNYNNYRFNGAISRVRVWRRALTPREVLLEHLRPFDIYGSAPVFPVGIRLNPSPVAVSIALPAPEVVRTISPAPVAVGLVVPAVGVALTLRPAPVVVSVALPAPELNRSIAPDPVPLSIGLPAPEVVRTITPAPVVVGIVVPVAGVALTLRPDPVVVSLALPAPAVDVPGAGLTLSPDPVSVSIGLPAPVVGVRTDTGLTALYPFYEMAGSTVHDVSGVGVATDLSILNGSHTWNRPDGGLTLTGPNGVFTTTPGKLVAALMATGEFTLEAWIVPATSDQEGRLISCDLGGSGLNYALGQGIDRGTAEDYGVGVRTSSNPGTTLNGSDAQVTGTLQHVVGTRSSDGHLRLYVDGVEDASSPLLVPGDFSVWDNFPFVLGATALLSDDWQGTYRLVAIFERALAPAEVAQHHAAGPKVAVPLALTPDPVVVSVAVPAPSVEVTGLTLTPAPVVVAAGVPAPTVVRTLEPDPVAVQVVLPAPAVDTPFELLPDPVAVALVLPAPSLDLPNRITPDPVGVSIGVPAPVVQVQFRITPGPVVLEVVLLDPVVLGIADAAVEFVLRVRRDLLHTLELAPSVHSAGVLRTSRRELAIGRAVAGPHAIHPQPEQELEV